MDHVGKSFLFDYGELVVRMRPESRKGIRLFCRPE